MLYLITIKQSQVSNGIKLEKGMSVEVSSNSSTPMRENQGKEVIDAFMRKYGIDIKKSGMLNEVFFDIKKLG